eukprot:750435-Hanusia_phi.AAC.4
MPSHAFPSSVSEREGHHELESNGASSFVESDLSAAVIYLTSSSIEDIQDLNQSLALLEKHYFQVHGYYPVYVFYDHLEVSTMQQLSRPNLNLSFHRVRSRRSARLSDCSLQIDMDVPPHQQEKYGNFSKKFLGYGLGYRAMCRFFSGPVYTHRAMQAPGNPPRLLLNLLAEPGLLHAARCGLLLHRASPHRPHQALGRQPSVLRVLGDRTGGAEVCRRALGNFHGGGEQVTMSVPDGKKLLTLWQTRAAQLGCGWVSRGVGKARRRKACPRLTRLQDLLLHQLRSERHDCLALAAVSLYLQRSG